MVVLVGLLDDRSLYLYERVTPSVPRDLIDRDRDSRPCLDNLTPRSVPRIEGATSDGERPGILDWGTRSPLAGGWADTRARVGGRIAWTR